MRLNQERQTAWQPADESSDYKPTIAAEYIIPQGFPMNPAEWPAWIAKWDLYHEVQALLPEPRTTGLKYQGSSTMSRVPLDVLKPIVLRLLPIMTLKEIASLFDRTAEVIVYSVLETKADPMALIAFDELARDPLSDPATEGRTLGLSRKVVTIHSSRIGRVPSAEQAATAALARLYSYQTVREWARAMAHEYSPYTYSFFENRLAKANHLDERTAA